MHFIAFYGMARIGEKRQEFRYQIVTQQGKSKNGLRIEAKQLCHRFLFLIFHFFCIALEHLNVCTFAGKGNLEKTTEK